MVVANQRALSVREGQSVKTAPRGGLSTFRVRNDDQLAFVRKYDVEASASRRLFWGPSRYVDSSNSGESLRSAKH